MIPASVITKLYRLSLDDDKLERVVGLLEECAEAVEAKASASIAARRASDRERKQRQRGGTMSRDITGRHVKERDARDSADSPSPKETSPTPPKEITPTHTLPSVGSLSRREQAFEQFWVACPHKVGKEAARKAFAKIGDRQLATLRELIDGMERYAQTKPADQPWCHPATWLNEHRWLDEPAAKPTNGHRPRAGPAPDQIRNTGVAAVHKFLARQAHEPDHNHPDEHLASAHEH